MILFYIAPVAGETSTLGEFVGVALGSSSSLCAKKKKNLSGSGMDSVRTIPDLCHRLISFAFQRCRVSDDLCRISVALVGSLLAGSPVVRISISDTGAASCLEEFQDLRVTDEGIFAEKWDGMLAVRTTGHSFLCYLFSHRKREGHHCEVLVLLLMVEYAAGASDEEVHYYNLNLKEGSSNNWLTRLPSITKNGVRFSGTEVCLSVSEKFEVLLGGIKQFVEKNIAFELAVQHENVYKSCYGDAFLPNKSMPSPFSASNVERLKYGLQDYILRRRNDLDNNLGLSLNALEHLRTGMGTICSSKTSGRQNPGLVVDAVIIICEFSDQTSPCPRECGHQTQVLYFKDFSPSSISKSSLSALKSIDWKSYGLTLGNIMDQGGGVSLEWDNLPPHTHIDVIFHCYQAEVNFPPSKQKVLSERSLLKKAAKLALDDMKEKHSGVLLSDRALKIQSHAPALARTLAGLILSSNDMEFQGECLSLLGLLTGVEAEIVEECVKDKINAVIELNDRKPERCKDSVPLLFEDDRLQEMNFEDECEEGDDSYDSLDI
ncbi:type 2 DNA topoisomerase 6 subunit B-like isoform X2 [Rhodamnia argentea]|uniref:Type 2 DNA topoisomerase 6 subunit B-like isoform X2 n=1 Tax=Rhodamnia argentea TaxID=178133 RepID=A0A8B8QFR6_9MYRT|nr:type 2 DNA topoisomerase 6 subunit B-like isoform X2 [Rhodamnia argentea]